MKTLTVWIIFTRVILGAPCTWKKGESVTVAGTIGEELQDGRRQNFFKLQVRSKQQSDCSGTIRVTLFDNSQVSDTSRSRLHAGISITVHGRIDYYYGEFEVIPRVDADLKFDRNITEAPPQNTGDSGRPLRSGSKLTLPRPLPKTPEKELALSPPSFATGPDNVSPPTNISGSKAPTESHGFVYWLFGLIVVLITMGFGIVRRSRRRAQELQLKLESVETKVTELQHRIITPTEFESMITTALEPLKHEHGSPSDEIRLLNERVTALIPKEGTAPPEFFWNNDIRSEFRRGIEEAKVRIDIESPWITTRVVKDLFSPLESALRKGVEIRIVYGYPDSRDPAANRKQDETKRQAAQLVDQLKRYDTRFKMRYGPTHGKAFICDDEFLLVGSFNFLSFEGIFYSDSHSEMVVKIRDTRSIRLLRTRTFDF